MARDHFRSRHSSFANLQELLTSYGGLERFLGIVKFLHIQTERYGFIVRGDAKEDIFFHVNGFERNIKPQVGDIVEFSEGENQQGIVAVRIDLLRDDQIAQHADQVVQLIFCRKLLKYNYRIFHQTCFKHIMNIYHEIPTARNKIIQQLKSFNDKEIKIYTGYLTSDQREWLSEIYNITFDSIPMRTQEVCQRNIFISSHDLYEILKRHIDIEIDLDLEEPVQGVHSLEEVRERLIALPARDIPLGARVAHAKICIAYLISEWGRFEVIEGNENRYEEDISGLLRD